jgi:hypothetical protein
VIWFMMENKPYAQIIGNTTEAPYENQVAGQCGLASSFYGITHPSLPNYIAATSGGTQGFTDNVNPTPTNRVTAQTIFDQAASLPGGWRAYEETMPIPCDFNDDYPYQAYHNPVLYYTNLTASCPLSDIALGTPASGNLATDLANDTLPAYAFITPNQYNNMHSAPISTGDAWLQTWITQITNSIAYRRGEVVVFITWDEDDYHQLNHIPLIVVNGYTPVGTTVSATHDLYSLLRTTEQLLGINTYLGNAATASSMRAGFGL